MQIATANNRHSTHWRNIEITWEAFVRRCREPIRTKETYAEYIAMDKDRQTRIKDVGGFVGGSLIGRHRRSGMVGSRSLITLDIDFGDGFDYERFCRESSLTSLVYSTHKHKSDAPRLRLIILPNRDMTPQEYQPVARMVAKEYVGLKYIDHTTFDICRMMFWGSVAKDADYYFQSYAGHPLDVDAVLRKYANWRDESQWPRCAQERCARPDDGHAPCGGFPEDPLTKSGIVGDFCRAYTISEAIDTFLSDIYRPTADYSRYTYIDGSTSGGLVVYDNKFAYSHHCTDPCSGKCCNAFDLVGNHLFGKYDDTFRRMSEFAEADERVKKLCAERTRDILACAGSSERTSVEVCDSEMEDDWIERLERKKSKGDKPEYKATAANVEIIFSCDPNLKGKIWMNDFTHDGVIDNAPWARPESLMDRWSDHDDAALRTYFEKNYGIRASALINDGLINILSANSRNPQKEWLLGLKWDGVRRVERSLVHYLGAEDDELTRAQTRKWLCAAAARIIEPGVKFDNALMLTGAQGAGKSSFFRILAGDDMFTDSVNIKGADKDTYLAMSRAWIIELAELASVKRASVEEVKGFLSAQSDLYRRPFERRSVNVPRHCVFCGTTNEEFFLVGNNGNRRFWCVRIMPELREFPSLHRSLEALKVDREQIWAEAVELWRNGESLFLDEHIERKAIERQDEMNVSAEDPIRATLEAYLRSFVPADWGNMRLQERRNYWTSYDGAVTSGACLRREVSAEEFVFERLGLDVSNTNVQIVVRRVREFMTNMGWVRKKNPQYILGGRYRKFEMPDGWMSDENDEL